MKANERANAPKYVKNKRREKLKHETSSESSNDSTSVSSVEGDKSSKSNLQKGKKIQKKNNLNKIEVEKTQNGVSFLEVKTDKTDNMITNDKSNVPKYVKHKRRQKHKEETSYGLSSECSSDVSSDGDQKTLDRDEQKRSHRQTRKISIVKPEDSVADNAVLHEKINKNKKPKK